MTSPPQLTRRWPEHLLGVRRLGSRTALFARRWTRSSRPRTQLFVMATPRVGGNLLVSYLNCLAEVSVSGEVLNSRTPQGIGYEAIDRAQVLAHLRRSLEAHGTLVGGVKILMAQLTKRGLGPADLLTVADDPRFLIVYRRSLADQFVSVLIARETDAWTLRRERSRQQRSVRVEPEQFRSFCDRTRRWYTGLIETAAVRSRAALVTYEDLTADAEGVFAAAVCPFLRVAMQPLRSRLLQQNPAPLSQKVENYTEVRELLAGPEARQDYAL